MAREKKWTKKDYVIQAEEFVCCYGKGNDWNTMVYDYCKLWEEENRPLPFDPDVFLGEIFDAEKRA